MEVNPDNPVWLEKSHPNFLRWKKARELSIDRGKFVSSVIKQQLQTKNLIVLDLGSGEGGTSKVFSDGNFVVSFDLSLIRLNRQKNFVISSESSSEKSSMDNENGFLPSFEMTGPKLVNGSALQLPFSDNSFDLIIIQDVIEHLTDVNEFYSEVKRVLKSKGTVYLSTPNKFSIFNFIADPHFGLPLVSLLNRDWIKKYFLKYFRKDDYNRTDIAQLFSLNDVTNLLKNDFEIKLHTKFSVTELFKGNKGIVWSNFHLKLIALCKVIKLDKVIIKIANDKIGLLNQYFTPTFYIILKKLT
ncbi:MAG: class I SAM-dependent methyltransferase [Ignavibacteriales bacterium]|nr:class I SAM-dependent methyltransferase [Ignavibacteriales bacterium]